MNTEDTIPNTFPSSINAIWCQNTYFLSKSIYSLFWLSLCLFTFIYLTFLQPMFSYFLQRISKHRYYEFQLTSLASEASIKLWQILFLQAVGPELQARIYRLDCTLWYYDIHCLYIELYCRRKHNSILLHIMYFVGLAKYGWVLSFKCDTWVLVAISLAAS